MATAERERPVPGRPEAGTAERSGIARLRPPRWLVESAVVVASVVWVDLALRLLGGSHLVADTLSSNIPLKVAAIQQLLDGQVPLWTSLLGSGIPLLADTISLPFDPRNLFFVVLPPVDAYLAMTVSSRAAGALILFFYLRRRHGLGFVASLTGTVVYLSATVFYDESRLHSTAVVLEGFPAVVWLTERLLDLPSWRRALHLALAWALLFAMGSVAYMLYPPFLAALWAVAIWLAAGRPGDWARIRRFLVAYAGAGVWGLVLAAALLVPFLELLGDSNRGGEYLQDPFIFRSFFYGIFGPHQVTLLVPTYTYFFYVGVVSLPLILIAARQRENPYLRALPWLAGGTLIVVGLLMTPLKGVLIDLLPPVASIPVFRVLFYWGFTAAVMVAYALDRPGWQLGRWTGRAARGVYWAQLAAVGAGILGLGFLGVLYFESHDVYMPVRNDLTFLIPIVFTIPFVPLILIRLAGLRLGLARAGPDGSLRWRGRRLPLREMVATLLLLELFVTWFFVRNSNLFGDPFPVTPEVAYLQERVGLDERVFQITPAGAEWGPLVETRSAIDLATLAYDAPAFHGIPTANLYESLIVANYGQLFVDAGSVLDVRAPTAYASGSDPETKFLDLLGVRYLYCERPMPESGRYREVLLGDSYHVYERTDPLPRAFFVSRAERLPADEVHERIAALAAGSGGWDPREEVLLAAEGTVSAAPPAERRGGRGYAPARVVSDTHEAVSVRVDAPSDGWLVLSDTMYPGWSARVDGEPVPIELANGFARAVPVEAGPNDVTFEFRSRSFTIGAWVSLAALALTGAALLARPLARRVRGRR